MQFTVATEDSGALKETASQPRHLETRSRSVEIQPTSQLLASPDWQTPLHVLGARAPIRWATHPDKCLDVVGGVAENGNNIAIFDCLQNGFHENEVFVHPESGRGPIRGAKNPQFCMDVVGGASFNGNNIALFYCLRNGTHPNQQFIMAANGTGPIRWATHPNKCLDVQGGLTNNGNNVGLYECIENGTHANMQFVVPAVQENATLADHEQASKTTGAAQAFNNGAGHEHSEAPAPAAAPLIPAAITNTKEEMHGATPVNVSSTGKSKSLETVGHGSANESGVKWFVRWSEASQGAGAGSGRGNTSDDASSCLAPRSDGCVAVSDEAACSSSRDGNVSGGASMDPCVWCGGGPCTNMSAARCERKSWLLDGKGLQHLTVAAKLSHKVAQCEACLVLGECSEGVQEEGERCGGDTDTAVRSDSMC